MREAEGGVARAASRGTSSAGTAAIAEGAGNTRNQARGLVWAGPAAREQAVHEVAIGHVMPAPHVFGMPAWHHDAITTAIANQPEAIDARTGLKCMRGG